MLKLLLSTLLLFLILSFLTTHSSAKIIYIDENSINSTSQGTLSNPYTSLADAVTNLNASENVEILLLGDSITISSILTFNGDITFTIKPEKRPETGYFPMRFEPGAGIMLADVNLTLEGIQIVELDMERNINTSLFAVNRSLLCLNDSLIANINYPNTSYRLITNLEEEDQADISEIWLVNTLFENLTNVNLYVEQAHIKIQDCKFHNLNMETGFFVTLYTMSSSILNITVINSTILNSRFTKAKAYVYPGFMSLFSGRVVGYFDGLTIRNCEFSNGAKAVGYSSFGAVNPTASFGIFNIVLQNVRQDEEIISGDIVSTGSGMIFDIIRGNSVNVSNFTVENLNLAYQALFRWTPQVGNLPGTQVSNTFASFTHISITNSSNPNWLLWNIAEITWENITLRNIYCNTTQTQFPLFSITNANSVKLHTVSGRNIFGPVFALLQVIYQEISNVTLDNVTNSLDLDINSRNVMLLQRDREILNLGLDLSVEMSTIIKDFHVNGFHVTKPENNGSIDDSFTSLIITVIELGTMSIENSTWENTEYRGFLGVSINILNVDNLTIKADPTNFAPGWRNIFELTSVNQLSITNSLFQNNPNITLIDLYNISRSGQYSTLNPISLTIENTTISNNTAGPENIALGASSLISILSSKESLQITIKESQFLGNMIGDGLIRSFESGQVSINVENSKFIENYASGNGTIFCLGKSLEGTENSLIMTGNSFIENHCTGNGGVMYFSEILGEVISVENDFLNNSAGIDGGVGYVMGGNLTYSDEKSLYSENLAEQSGSLFYGDSVDFSFNKSQIEDVENKISRPVSLIDLDSGSIIMENTSIVNITGILLFDLKNVSGRFEDVKISEIDCSMLESACIIEGGSVSLEFIETEVSDVILGMGKLIEPCLLSEEILKELVTEDITRLS